MTFDICRCTRVDNAVCTLAAAEGHGYVILAPTALAPSLYLVLRARPWHRFHN